MTTTKQKSSTELENTIKSLLKLQEINQNLDNLVEEIDILKDEAEQEEKKYLTKKIQYDKHFPYLEKSTKEYEHIQVELSEIKQRIEEFLSPLDILPYDEIAADIYGGIRLQLEKCGEPIGPLNLLIAAHALSRNLVLISNNEKEFKRVKTLKVENWISPPQ